MNEQIYVEVREEIIVVLNRGKKIYIIDVWVCLPFSLEVDIRGGTQK